MISGFTLPSYDGPADEKAEISLLMSTAPTEITFSASEGAIMYFQSLSRSLPALLTTTIPLDAAIPAAFVTKAVLPSRSEYL